MTQRRGNWSQTYSGRQFWPLDPRPYEVDIRDIAHALSLQCRFAGHCLEFYSVAQHSVFVAELCVHMDGDPLWGLLHDAAEAYLGDLIQPIKHSADRGALGAHYRAAERGVMQAVMVRFQLSYPRPTCVGLADKVALATEARDLMAPAPAPWAYEGLEPWPDMIEPWPAKQAEWEFLRAFEVYGGGAQ